MIDENFKYCNDQILLTNSCKVHNELHDNKENSL